MRTITMKKARQLWRERAPGGLVKEDGQPKRWERLPGTRALRQWMREQRSELQGELVGKAKQIVYGGRHV